MNDGDTNDVTFNIIQSNTYLGTDWSWIDAYGCCKYIAKCTYTSCVW